MRNRTKYLILGFIIALLAVATVAVVFESKPVEAATDAQTECFVWALGECGGIDHLDCVKVYYFVCNNPIFMPDGIDSPY